MEKPAYIVPGFTEKQVLTEFRFQWATVGVQIPLATLINALKRVIVLRCFFYCYEAKEDKNEGNRYLSGRR